VITCDSLFETDNNDDNNNNDGGGDNDNNNDYHHHKNKYHLKFSSDSFERAVANMLLFIIACHQTYVIGRSEYTGKHCVDCDDCGGDNDCGDDDGGDDDDDDDDDDDSNRCLHCLFMTDPETKQIINLQLKVRMIIIIVINIIITTIIVIIIVTGESTCGHRPQEIV